MISTALVVGAGDGLSAAIARGFAGAKVKVALAARNPDKLSGLCAEIGAQAFRCDAGKEENVARLFTEVEATLGAPGVVVYNAAAWVRAPLLDLTAADVSRSLGTNAMGAFLIGQAAARQMVAKGGGTIIFTGATASIRGSALFAASAMGKFAARALAQSMARELGAKGVHVAHVIIDGPIKGGRFPGSAAEPDGVLEPSEIADIYLHLAQQRRSAWTHEVDVRTWTETF
jgi:NAD(P)-dependent dehydrogenase (short-subunit alcohol dehydrogenase family)